MIRGRCYDNLMQRFVTVSAVGTIRLPDVIRSRHDLQEGTQLLIEVIDGGLLLRPIADDMIEMYTDERIREFTADEEVVEEMLKKRGR